MAGPSSPDSHSRKAQPEPDALNDSSSSSDAALGRTLEAELTRAATRANPASLTPSSPSPVTASPASGDAETEGDADAKADAGADAVVDAGADASTSGDAPADDPEAEDAQTSASRSPRIGWGGVLALLNVVLSGFILMLWGVPRWDAGRAGAQHAGAARAKNPGAGGAGGGVGAGAGAGVPAAAGVTGVASPSSASAGGEAGTTSLSAASLASGLAGVNASAGPGGLPRRVMQPGASATDPSGGAVGAGAGGVDVPELPQAIMSVMPGQRAPDVSAPTSPREPDAAAADAEEKDDADAGAITAGADDAIEVGNAAARATGDGGALRIPIAGADGVTMPERLAESHVRPTIAALADGEPVTGEVRLAATIRVDGSVADVQVLSSSRTGAGLEHAAADAVRRWRYKPATRDGQPIDSRLTITVTFR
jgi:TonB family protein